MALEKELETYARELPKLLEHTGKFVVIHENSVVGVFDTYEDALSAAYTQVGLKPFLIQEIAEFEEPVIFVNSTIQPCRI